MVVVVAEEGTGIVSAGFSCSLDKLQWKFKPLEAVAGYYFTAFQSQISISEKETDATKKKQRESMKTVATEQLER